MAGRHHHGAQGVSVALMAGYLFRRHHGRLPIPREHHVEPEFGFVPEFTGITTSDCFGDRTGGLPRDDTTEHKAKLSNSGIMLALGAAKGNAACEFTSPSYTRSTSETERQTPRDLDFRGITASDYSGDRTGGIPRDGTTEHTSRLSVSGIMLALEATTENAFVESYLAIVHVLKIGNRRTNTRRFGLHG